MSKQDPIRIVGGGLAGCEAAWQVANSGINVVLYEMRPIATTAAHKTDGLAELVCSNSFRSDDATANAVGLLHEEMRRAGSAILSAADSNKVPAGSALAVDRDGFSETVQSKILNHPNIEVKREEVSVIPLDDWSNVIIATGPLTSPGLSDWIINLAGQESLAFFDAIAPILHKDSINFDTAWFQSRYDKVGPGGDGKDYINCPMNRVQYDAFIDALLEAEYTEFHEWEKDTPYFDGCLPIEVMAERGRETLRHGPLKPVGLTDPNNPDVKPAAIVQLRQDNALGTLYNMVGFQTKMKYGEQVRIFKTIPGLEDAEFARLGGIHRNTFMNSPDLLDKTLANKEAANVRFAGQMTGCEGYVESAAIGLLAGLFAVASYRGVEPSIPPITTAFGALLNHITEGHLPDQETGKRGFQPMNINFGLFPEVQIVKPEGVKRFRGKEKAIAKKNAICKRALNDLDMWLDGFKSEQVA